MLFHLLGNILKTKAAQILMTSISMAKKRNIEKKVNFLQSCRPSSANRNDRRFCLQYVQDTRKLIPILTSCAFFNLMFQFHSEVNRL